MDIEIDRVTLLEDTIFNACMSNEAKLKAFKNYLTEYVDTISQLLSIDPNKISGEEFYNILKKKYSIFLDEGDYLNILSKKYKRKFDDIRRIYTKMTFECRVEEGHGRDFSWWNQEFQVYLNSAVARDVRNNYNKNYSKDKIRRLIENKDIVVFNYGSKEINGKPDFKKEEFEMLPNIDVILSPYGNSISKYVEENYDLFGKLLAKKFSKNTIISDMEDYVEDIQCDLDTIFENVESPFEETRNVAVQCKTWFDTSEIGKEYKGLQKKLVHKK